MNESTEATRGKTLQTGFEQTTPNNLPKFTNIGGKMR